jgi:hypothetical protein
MPRANRLPPLRFVCYYYRRVAARERSIVNSREELETIVDTLIVTLKKSGASLYACHIDSRELHLVLRAEAVPLLPALGHFCHDVARCLNRRRGERGSLFTQRARVTLFQPEIWLLPIARYVHAIRLRCAADLSWNSDGTYRNHRRTKGLSTTAIMRSLGSSVMSSEVPDSAYSAYFDAPPEPEEVGLIERGSVVDSRVLGNKVFIDQVMRAQGAAEGPGAARDQFPREVIQRAAEQVMGCLRVLCHECLGEREAQKWVTRTTLEQLRSRSRRMPLPFVRGMIAEYVLARHLAKRSEIESFFGLRPKSLSAGLRHRYRSKLLKLLLRRAGTAGSGLPDFERRAKRTDSQSLKTLLVVPDRRKSDVRLGRSRN